MTLTEKKGLVGDFIARCNHYADGKIAGYRRELEHASGDRIRDLEDKIRQWSDYRAFNEYTIEELKAATLDHWFE